MVRFGLLCGNLLHIRLVIGVLVGGVVANLSVRSMELATSYATIVLILD